MTVSDKLLIEPSDLILFRDIFNRVNQTSSRFGLRLKKAPYKYLKVKKLAEEH